MKFTLIKKITLIAIVGILICGFMLSVQGVQSTRIRPIDDWIYGNDRPPNWDYMDKWSTHTVWAWDDWDKSDTMTGTPFGTWRGFTNIESKLVIHFDWVALNNEIEYTGFVLEREMPDGSLKIKVDLHVKGIYFELYKLPDDWVGQQPAWMYIEELVLIGTMDYTFQFEFILDKEIPGGYIWWLDMDIPSRLREPGEELPSFWKIWYIGDFIGACDLTFIFTGMGSGNIVQSGWLPPESLGYPEFWWFVPPKTEIPAEEMPVLTGETAKVKVQQISLIIPHSPNFFWGWFWPCDIIEIL